MCGIYGWSFKKKAKIPSGQREAMASALAVANSLRGDQSWGMYLGYNDGKIIVKRDVGDVARVSGIAAWGNASIAMGHTRWATTGKVTAQNAHPFKVGSVLLAHNGVIYNHSELNRKHDRKCEVDSEHFAYHLDQSKPFSDIEGYGAIEWVEDRDAKAVHFARLRGGSLHAYGVKNAHGAKVGVVWSSDEAHLKSALGAARLDCYPFEPLKEGQVYQANQGVLYVLDRPLLELSKSSIDASWEARWQRATSGAITLYGRGRRDYEDDWYGDHGFSMTDYYRSKYGIGQGVADDGRPFAGKDAVTATSYLEQFARIRQNDLKYAGHGMWVNAEGNVIEHFEPEDPLEEEEWIAEYGVDNADPEKDEETMSVIELMKEATAAK